MNRSETRLVATLFLFGIAGTADVLMPACASDTSCLRNSDCDNGYSCNGGVCTVTIPVDSGPPDTNVDDGAVIEAGDDAGDDSGDDAGDDATDDANDAGDGGLDGGDAHVDAPPVTDGSTDAHTDAPHTDGGGDASKDGATDAPLDAKGQG